MCYSGAYIVIEGGEGSGKTTTIESLKKLYPDAVFVKEPGGPIGDELKKVIFSEKRADITDAYLFATARAELIASTIIPALKAGKTVISDRSVVSSIVYQGIVGALGEDLVEEINIPALQDLSPDKIVYFRTSWETSQARTAKRKSDGGESNYYDEAGKAFFEKVDKAYMTWGKPNDLFVVLDANQENEKRVAEMKKIISSAK